VEIDVNRRGIAVRVEVPREFLNNVAGDENDTHFIQSDIRNDYYYYSTVDEARHWSHEENRTASQAPCYKPNFGIYDPNAPWCVEIWNYLNGKFLNFTGPRFIRFTNLNAPSIAGSYNVTLFVANHTNSLHLPDFIDAWNTTFFVPVSMSDNPGSISGTICDDDTSGCSPILAKGVVLAKNTAGQVVARGFVNQTTGAFSVTGLAPGTYQVQASAGLFNGVAYSLSDPISVSVSGGHNGSPGSIHLHRAPQVCGKITYENDNPIPVPILHSLSDHPYLTKIGVKADSYKLNITVEGVDPSGHIFRNMTTSLDQASDDFILITGLGEKYFGGDPYGTEFAGLPPVATGSYQMTLNFYITGYLQKFTETVTVSVAAGRTSPLQCNNPNPSPVVMLSAGVITADIQFFNLGVPETPAQAEISTDLSSPSGSLFGGNILIQAYDHSGALRGVTVVNGTANGITTYKDLTSLRLYIIGFSEFYYRTLSGPWGEYDSGIPGDLSGYTLNVRIRGYNQTTNPIISLPGGGNATAAIRMTRGGAISVDVLSFDNRPGTRAAQAALPFRFLNLSIPVVARVYFDDSGTVVGYVERVMVIKSAIAPLGVSTKSFNVVFTGMNWNLPILWYYSKPDRDGLGRDSPTFLGDHSYSIKAYTLGYVQQRDVSSFVGMAGVARSAVTLFIGNEVDITGPVYLQPTLFGQVPEHAHAIGEVFSGSLTGAETANVTAGTKTLGFTIFGFGATEVNASLPFVGQGHFFYVDPTGTTYFDYGLDVGSYAAHIPEFGFNVHFTAYTADPTVTFQDLFLQLSPFISMVTMAKVFENENLPHPIAGWVAGSGGSDVMPLSWVHVEAVNGTFDRFVPTLDGVYDGPGALFLPAGVYNITFSVPFYKTSGVTVNFPVDWAGSYPLLPPDGYLCPINNAGLPCDPPLEIFGSPAGGSSSPGALVLTSQLNLRKDSYSGVSYFWSASQGRLNATSGRAVFWTRTNQTEGNVTIYASALVNTGSGPTLLFSAEYTPPDQAIPEFHASPSTLMAAILLSLAVLVVNRKTRNELPRSRKSALPRKNSRKM
jgi:hypothetical protein